MIYFCMIVITFHGCNSKRIIRKNPFRFFRSDYSEDTNPAAGCMPGYPCELTGEERILDRCAASKCKNELGSSEAKRAFDLICKTDNVVEIVKKRLFVKF